LIFTGVKFGLLSYGTNIVWFYLKIKCWIWYMDLRNMKLKEGKRKCIMSSIIFINHTLLHTISVLLYADYHVNLNSIQFILFLKSIFIYTASRCKTSQ
jgi:hypothetical protein